MKVRKLILLGFTTLMLVSCGEQASTSGSSSSSSSSGSSTSQSTGSSSSSSTTSGSSSSSTGTSTSTSTSTSEEPAPTKVTIAQARALCAEKVTNLNSRGLGVNMDYRVTIEGLAINRFDLVKTKASFGLDVSKPAKVVFGDESGYIACASPAGDGSTLYGKVDDHSGEATSSYSVTGYLSMYLGQPEIYVPAKTFEWNSSLGKTYDAMTQNDGVITVDQFYTNAKAVKYNCAGHGYGGIYRLNDVLCIAKAGDGTAYSFTDGYKIFKGVPYKANTFTVGSKYNLAGMISTRDWVPALRIMKSSASTATIPEDYKTPVVKEIDDLNKVMASKDDTDTRFDSYIDTFSHIYSCTAYGSYYVRDKSKMYVTIKTSYLAYSSKSDVVESENTAHEKGMAALENENCWNVWYSNFSGYCPIKDYFDLPDEFDLDKNKFPKPQNEAFTVNYLPWQLTYHKNGKVYAHWKINIFVDSISPVA